MYFNACNNLIPDSIQIYALTANKKAKVRVEKIDKKDAKKEF